MFLSLTLLCKGYKHYVIESYSPGSNSWHYRQTKQFRESIIF